MNLAQKRKKRIQELFAWAKKNGIDYRNVGSFDVLLEEARKRWTYTTVATLKSYVVTVLEILKRESPKKSGEES